MLRIERQSGELRATFLESVPSTTNGDGKATKALIDEHGTKLEASKDLSQSLREQQDSLATLVYWRDEAGEHSFITEQLTIDRAR